MRAFNHHLKRRSSWAHLSPMAFHEGAQDARSSIPSPKRNVSPVISFLTEAIISESHLALGFGEVPAVEGASSEEGGFILLTE